MKKLIQPYLLLLAMSCMVIALSAQEFPVINIQGTLKDGDGSALPDGTYSVIFRLFNQETDGELVWQEEATVESVGGIFIHNLGSMNQLNSRVFSTTVYLGLKVGNFEMNPRTRMTYAPYTFTSTTVICSGALGDVKYSTLSPAKFAEVNGACWVPMDGRSIVGSRLAAKIGISNLPDAGGMFIRGQEFASSPNYDTGRDSNSPIAAAQIDDVKPHNHSMNNAGGHNHIYDYFVASGPTNLRSRADFTNIRYGIGWQGRSTSTAGNHAHEIYNNSGNETRPKNQNLWTYIRIN